MTSPTFLAKGAFADVWDMHDGTVLKAYRSEPRSHGFVVEMQDHDLLTSVFCTKEINAYKQIMSNPEVNAFIPNFYGRCNPSDLLSDPPNRYVENAGLIIQKVIGSDSKIVNLDQSPKHAVDIILSKIESIVDDINVWDSSCFYTSYKEFKLIDFALWKSPTEFQCHLYEHGRLNQFQVQQLRRLMDYFI